MRLGDLKILPASLSVKANDTAIYQGDATTEIHFNYYRSQEW